MNYSRFYRIYLILLLFFCSYGCGNIPSTEELDNDISLLSKEIESATKESDLYSGGLIKVLVDIRKEVLTNTKLMVEQKRTGFKRFININYNIDGKQYSPPNDKNELLSQLQKQIDTIQREIEKDTRESERYSGGLIKIMIDARIATSNNTKAFLQQKELLLKHDIPFYAIIPSPSSEVSDKENYKSTPGEDLDKF